MEQSAKVVPPNYWGVCLRDRELFAIFRLIFLERARPRSHFADERKELLCGRGRFSARVLTRRKFMEQILRHFHSSKFRPLPSFIEKAVGWSRESQKSIVTMAALSINVHFINTPHTAHYVRRVCSWIFHRAADATTLEAICVSQSTQRRFTLCAKINQRKVAAALAKSLLFCLREPPVFHVCLLCAQPITQIMRRLCVYAYTAPGVIEEKTNLPLPPSAERVCFHYVNSSGPDRWNHVWWHVGTKFWINPLSASALYTDCAVDCLYTVRRCHGEIRCMPNYHSQ